LLFDDERSRSWAWLGHQVQVHGVGSMLSGQWEQGTRWGSLWNVGVAVSFEGAREGCEWVCFVDIVVVVVPGVDDN
jgi:hypothetical protein